MLSISCASSRGQEELDNFHSHMGTRDEIWKWRDAQRHSGVLQRMQTLWGLEDDFIVFGEAARSIGLKEFMFKGLNAGLTP